MMADVLADLAQATPEWLSHTLRAGGALPRGKVEEAEQRRVGASSQVAYLALRYSLEAPSGAPRHLVLKLADPDLERRMPRRNRAEIAFYRALLDGPRDLPTVRCHAAAYADDNPDRFHLLLDDPSATEYVAFRYSAVPPTLTQCEAIVDALALVHARCWEDWDLGTRLQGARPDEQHTGALTPAFVAWAGEIVPRFLEDLGDRFPAARRDLYTRLGALAPARLLARQERGRALTVTQGDVHIGNFLYPRDPATGTPYIIDWKRAGITVGANDLAYMMALYWFPAVRGPREGALLRRYHERLRANGVADYGWDDLWTDYRLCVARQFFEAVWGWLVGQNPTIWWNHLERITLAIENLRCLDLL